MHLQFDQDNNFVHITMMGTLGEAEILQAFDAAVTANEYKDGMGRLWDFRDADLSTLETNTIKRMAQYSLSFPPGINDVKVAFVADRPLEFGLSRMFENFSLNTHTKIRVFDNLAKAEEWMMKNDG